MTWLGWLAAYLTVSALIAELSMLALRRQKGTPMTGPGYVALVLLWPLMLAVAIVGMCLRKGRRNG